MTTKQLTTYVTALFAFESELFILDRIAENLKPYVEENRPKPPKQPNVPMPHKPRDIEEDLRFVSESHCALFVCSIIMFVLSFILIAASASAAGICLLFASIIMFTLHSSRHCKRKIEAEALLEKYNARITEYYKKCKEATDKYQADLSSYEAQAKKYDEKWTYLFDKHNEVVEKLEHTRDIFYEKGIIFPKYRNLVAVSAFYEYLITGRCETLDGTNGAYNLYERSTSLHIIAKKSNNISEFLSQLQYENYTLFEKFMTSSIYIDSLIANLVIHDDTESLLAHYSDRIRLAEESLTHVDDILKDPED